MPKRLLIEGVVQGVGYRQWLCRQADRLGVTGWVRNRRDGSVEALLDGPDAAIESLIEAAGRGPAGARVDNVHTEAADGSFTRFETRPTA